MNVGPQDLPLENIVDQFDSCSCAADVWALMVQVVTDAQFDIPTLAIWASLLALSAATLRQRCYAAGVAPRRSLLFARLLRAVKNVQGRRWDPAEWFNFSDPRTLRSLLDLHVHQRPVCVIRPLGA